MKNQNHGQVLGILVSSVSYQSQKLEEVPPSSNERKGFFMHWMSKLRKKAGRQGPKTSLKGKLSLSSRIVEAGGVERVFKQVFYLEKGEKLLKAYQCYLSTTAGPIAGIIFISTEKVAFHSEKLLKLTGPGGQLARVPYKVLIPLRRMKSVVSRENTCKSNQKYIQVITMDDFEFWLTGFVNHQRSFKYLQQALFVSH